MSSCAILSIQYSCVVTAKLDKTCSKSMRTLLAFTQSIFSKSILSNSYPSFLITNKVWSILLENAIVSIPTVLRYVSVGNHTITFFQAWPGLTVIPWLLYMEIALHNLSSIVVILQHFFSHLRVVAGIGIYIIGKPSISSWPRVHWGKLTTTYNGKICCWFRPLRWS